MPPVYHAEVSLFRLALQCVLARLVSVLPFSFTLSLLYTLSLAAATGACHSHVAVVFCK